MNTGKVIVVYRVYEIDMWKVVCHMFYKYNAASTTHTTATTTNTATATVITTTTTASTMTVITTII